MASQAVIKKMDTVFQRYIRLRDTKGEYFICCSCGAMKDKSQIQAGHWINRRWMATRWREDNVHGQCISCNMYDEGNGPGYTRFMQRTYGDKHVEYLLAIKNEQMLYHNFEVELLIKEYKKKIKELK